MPDGRGGRWTHPDVLGALKYAWRQDDGLTDLDDVSS